MAATNLTNNSALNEEVVHHRPIANFSPSLWGDFFLNFSPHAKTKEGYSKEIEALKDEVKSMLTTPTSDIVEMMELIDTLERMSLSYHFEDIIEDKLQKCFNLNIDYKNEDYDLYTIALHFRLFRAHGHHMSSDAFSKFMDDGGNFQESIKSDARGMLSLYEAAHLRTRGEDILDNALVFATASMKSMVQDLCSPLREQVARALVQPLHLGSPRIEARHFISIYEKREQKNESLLRLAKLDYNNLQILHKEELCELSRWWKDLDLPSKLPYARDRVVECYYWALAVYYQPQYSRSRIFVAKAISMTSMIDDTYDSYGTLEELNVITKAIERWDISEIDELPNYFKPFYKALLELYEQFEQELASQGQSYGVYYAKKALKELVRSYQVEAKWFIKGYLPPFDEYLSNALITCTYYYHTTISLFGTNATKEQFEWLVTKPKVLLSGVVICRVIDDIATYEVEKERGQIATGIECYMRENGVTVEEAKEKFAMARNAWKDMNAELLKAQPRADSRNVVTRILNFARIIEVAYKGNQDGYTKPEKVVKPHIIGLVVEQI